jgi:hypothetical protein
VVVAGVEDEEPDCDGHDGDGLGPPATTPDGDESGDPDGHDRRQGDEPAAREEQLERDLGLGCPDPEETSALTDDQKGPELLTARPKQVPVRRPEGRSESPPIEGEQRYDADEQAGPVGETPA